jgi:hypothetical protein
MNLRTARLENSQKKDNGQKRKFLDPPFRSPGRLFTGLHRQLGQISLTFPLHLPPNLLA